MMPQAHFRFIFRLWMIRTSIHRLEPAQICRGLRIIREKSGFSLMSYLPSVMAELNFIWLWPFDHVLTLKMTKIKLSQNAFFADQKLFKFSAALFSLVILLLFFGFIIQDFSSSSVNAVKKVI